MQTVMSRRCENWSSASEPATERATPHDTGCLFSPHISLYLLHDDDVPFIDRLGAAARGRPAADPPAPRLGAPLARKWGAPYHRRAAARRGDRCGDPSIACDGLQ